MRHGRLSFGFSSNTRNCCACVPAQTDSTVRGNIPTKLPHKNGRTGILTNAKTAFITANGSTGDSLDNTITPNEPLCNRFTNVATFGLRDKKASKLPLSSRDINQWPTNAADR